MPIVHVCNSSRTESEAIIETRHLFDVGNKDRWRSAALSVRHPKKARISDPRSTGHYGGGRLQLAVARLVITRPNKTLRSSVSLQVPGSGLPTPPSYHVVGLRGHKAWLFRCAHSWNVVGKCGRHDRGRGQRDGDCFRLKKLRDMAQNRSHWRECFKACPQNSHPLPSLKTPKTPKNITNYVQ